MPSTEIYQIDRRFENLRIKNQTKEGNILHSISLSGLKTPVDCVFKDGCYILLDGFKRLRSLMKLKVSTIDVELISEDLSAGIIKLIRQNGNQTLQVIEEAGFIEELKCIHSLSNKEIAEALERSPAWVCVRLGIFENMGSYVRNEIFAGRFPLRAYLYNLRKFTRVNSTVTNGEINEFVASVTNKGLSTRQIESAAKAFFFGSEEIKKQIKSGSIDFTVSKLTPQRGVPSSEQKHFNSPQQQLISALELLQSSLNKVSYQFKQYNTGKSINPSNSFLLEGVIKKMNEVKANLDGLL